MSTRGRTEPSIAAGSGATVLSRSATMVFGTVEALAPTSFTLGPGECLVVTGPNGSGKSTLLGLVAGRLAPTAGTVLVLDRAATEARRAAAAEISVMTGGFASYPDLTVREHLDLVSAAWPAEVLAGTSEDMLRRTRLDVVQDQLPGELSSGERQMFSLACATMRPARLLVLDEPEQRLDPARTASTIDVLHRAKARGCSLVLATHSAEIRDALADQSLDLRARAA